jgi:hypothetical protein
MAIKRNLSYFAKILPLIFPEIFNIFRIRGFFFFLRIQENFEKHLKPPSFVYFLKKYRIIVKKTIVYECLQYDIKQKSFTFLVCDLENWRWHILERVEI